MIWRCLECFASNAYSCFSRAALTSMAVLKVLLSVSIIVIVAVKLEDVRVELQLPASSLADITSILAGGQSPAASPQTASGALAPSARPSPPTYHASGSPLPPSPASLDVDLNTTTGPLHVDAACLLQKRGAAGQLSDSSRTMCSYVYGVCAVSLVATFVMASLLWCTCHCCGWGPLLELMFAVLGTAWWLAAALVLQEHTDVAVNAAPAALHLTLGFQLPPPPFSAALSSLLPPPPPPPGLPPPPPLVSEGDVGAQLEALLRGWLPRSLRQWRGAVVALSWVMMGLFGGSGVLLLVEACGCLVECCACVCRCCCCPDRPDSRWRSNLLRRRKRMDGEEYVEMSGSLPPSAAAVSGFGSSSSGLAGGGGGGGGPPSIMVVARSDAGAFAPLNQQQGSSGGGEWGSGGGGGKGDVYSAGKGGSSGWWR